MTAAFHGCLDVVLLLLSQGAEVSAKSHKVRRLRYLLSCLGSFLVLCSKAVDPNFELSPGAALFRIMIIPMASSSCPHAWHMLSSLHMLQGSDAMMSACDRGHLNMAKGASLSATNGYVSCSGATYRPSCWLGSASFGSPHTCVLCCRKGHVSCMLPHRDIMILWLCCSNMEQTPTCRTIR